MLTIHEAQKPRAGRRKRSVPRVGLAVAGGGPVGAIYELGALRALDESIDGLRLHDLDVYVGVSAGAFIAASLANRISTAEMCRIFMGHPAAEFKFRPDEFLRPAYAEYLQRARRLPGIVRKTLLENLKHPSTVTMSQWMGALSRAVPSGLFDNDNIHRFLETVYNSPGRTDDFRTLEPQLYVVAVDLDNGVAIRFGSPGYEDVPISRAVQASAALPGLYSPVEINGRYMVDGALRRTLHASAALDTGVDLLLGVNPLVPYDSGDGESQPHMPVQKLIQGGLPMILSQTLRALIQSRMKIGFAKYKSSHPGTDLLLMEPNRADEALFFTNVFSFASRNALCEHAYQSTRRELREHADQIGPMLARSGLALNLDRLADEDRTLETSLDEDHRGYSEVGRRLSRSLSDLDQLLPN